MHIKNSRLFLAPLVLLPVLSFAKSSFDAETGIVNLPNVAVDDKFYSVKMQHQGDLVFKVSAEPQENTESTADQLDASTYDLETSELYIPDIAVGSDHFSIDMLHQGDFVFKVTSATPLQSSELASENQDEIPFTPNDLVGKTFYEVYVADVDGEEFWVIDVLVFTETTVTFSAEEDPSLASTKASYTITPEGYVKMSFAADEVDFMKAIEKTNEYITIEVDDSKGFENASLDDDFLFFDRQKAKDFVKANSEPEKP